MRGFDKLDRRALRQSAGEFVRREVAPCLQEWEDAGEVPRSLHLAGEKIGALAVTEPGGGSDVAAIRTTARRDGDEYVVDGTKTFTTSGVRADFVTIAVRTSGPGHQGISLVVVEKGTPGFTVDRSLAKMGWHCSGGLRV